MALDTYIVREIAGNFLVFRYKSKELLDSMKVGLSGPCASSIEKRRSIVKQWVNEGKPLSAVYWFENDKVVGKKLDQS